MLRRLWFRSYLQAIRNSVGSSLFRNFYIEEDGKERDVFNNGEFSSAYFVSGILSLFSQQKKPHATVKSTVEDLLEHGWEELKFSSLSDLEEGDVLRFEEMEFPEEPGALYEYLAFFLSPAEAVGNDYRTGVPEFFKLNLDQRAVTHVYRGRKKLEELPQPEEA